MEEVTVYAGQEDYPNRRVSFRKSVTVGGFDYFKDQLTVERIRITGSDDYGSSLTACADIVIKNPSNASVLVDELPVEVYYGGVKIAFLTVPPFKLRHSLRDAEFRAEIPVKFQPENSRDIRCKEFIAKYITSQDSIGIFSLWKGLRSNGMDKQFSTGCTAYIPLIRTLLTKRFKYTFEFENPIDIPLTITFIEGNLRLIAGLIDATMVHLGQANAILTSRKLRKASLPLMLHKSIGFLGKKQITVDVDIQRANANIGKFNLPDLTFNNLTDIKTTLKWSLY